MKAKNYIPDGFNTVTPYLIVEGAEGLIEFIKKGLGGEEVFMMRHENNLITHATVKIGNSMIMIADKTPDMEKPELAMLYLYVKDVDALTIRPSKQMARASLHQQINFMATAPQP